MLTTRMLNDTFDRMLTINRALDQAAQRGSDAPRSWVPAFDVAERKDAYVLLAELPGVNPEDVEVAFEQNVLTVRGTKRPSFDTAKAGELRLYAAERLAGRFERSVRLPESVDADRIDAAFAHGLLTITVPKAQAAQARKITIRGATEPGRVESGSAPESDTDN